MNDNELIELAAKAAGVCLHPKEKLHHSYGNWGHDIICTVCKKDTSYSSWSPLRNDGDALRLAVKLGISVSYSHSTGLDVPYPTIVEVGAFAGWCPTFTETNADDWAFATRRAIVRAAAEIGKAMP